MENREKSHFHNLESVIRELHNNIVGVWGDAAVYIYDMEVVRKEEINFGEIVKSNVWIKANVLTGDYKTGTHLVKVELEHASEITAEEYVESISRVLKKTGMEKGIFYSVENGKVESVMRYRDKCVITFSAIAFEVYMSVRTELKNTFKGMPVINDNFHVLHVRYIKNRIGKRSSDEVESVRLSPTGNTILEVMENNDTYVFGLTYVYIKMKNEETEQRIVLPYANNLNGLTKRSNFLRLQDRMKKSVNQKA